ncbi:L-rhamnose mutarotase [Pseudomonas fluorescens]|uniref:L-rhamnose mutarotase n=1 Tax=Pseudomonas fluorescens TaxID=294 RepID=A0A379IEM7_PSEFL|nr:L-rhamnose mutarotase [Pseudomonas fluorescens]AIG01474.1 L-rhamnose mutarotase [Pseudomonas fluorescens]SUD31242.1 L-rhamnose mutarotase [Pseudomonas fluorescens]
MQTRAFRMNLNPGMAAEYRLRHEQIWPELALRDAGVVDYRIFLDEPTHALFAVLTHHDEHGLDALPGTPLMQRWWHYMHDIMPSHADHSPVSVNLEPMFCLAPG